MSELLHPPTGLPVGELKLGRAPRRLDRRTLSMAAYIDQATMPTPPAVLDLTLGVGDWPMYGNDRLSDCTAAALAHMIEIWSLESGNIRTLAEPDVEAFYFKCSGGQDQGAVELDVLNLARQEGIGGDKIMAYAACPVSNHKMVMTTNWLFSGVYIGVGLPLSAQAQLAAGAVWDVPADPSHPDAQIGSWGGHAVDVCGHTPDGVEVVTWGAVQKMTWAFWDKYVEEAYGILPAEAASWMGKDAAHGFNLAQLQQDLDGL